MPHDYSGWDTGDSIRNHYLSTSIINGHSAEEGNYVFDNDNLQLLKRFCVLPTVSNRDAILAERGYSDPLDAANAGSLTCFVIGRHGTDDPAFDNRDLELLQDWFDKGMPVGQHVTR